MLKSILEAQLYLGCQQNCENSKDLSERAFEPKIPEIYKSKLQISCYNIIIYFKEYLALSKSQDCKQSSYTTTFFKRRALNNWNHYKQKIVAKTLVFYIWAVFKIILQKSLAKNSVFLDNIWKKFRTVNKFQPENVKH